jgi:hypothetical protein
VLPLYHNRRAGSCFLWERWASPSVPHAHDQSPLAFRAVSRAAEREPGEKLKHGSSDTTVACPTAAEHALPEPVPSRRLAASGRVDLLLRVFDLAEGVVSSSTASDPLPSAGVSSSAQRPTVRGMRGFDGRARACYTCPLNGATGWAATPGRFGSDAATGQRGPGGALEICPRSFLEDRH